MATHGRVLTSFHPNLKSGEKLVGGLGLAKQRQPRGLFKPHMDSCNLLPFIQLRSLSLSLSLSTQGRNSSRGWGWRSSDKQACRGFSKPGFCKPHMHSCSLLPFILALSRSLYYGGNLCKLGETPAQLSTPPCRHNSFVVVFP